MTSDGLTYNIAERPYFQEAITGKAAVSDTIDDYRSQADQCLCRAGFSAKSGGRSGGGIRSRNREDEKISGSRQFSNQGYSYIVKANGDAVVTSAHANSPGDFGNVLESLKKARYAQWRQLGHLCCQHGGPKKRQLYRFIMAGWNAMPFTSRWPLMTGI